MVIEKIRIIGLFKYLNYELNLNRGINVLHGVNGKGKTTILNILTNILNGELNKFHQLSFKEVKINFENNNYFKIYRGEGDEAKKVFFDHKFNNELFEKKEARNSNSVKAFLKRLNLNPLLLPAQRVSLEETYYQDDFRQRGFHYRDDVYRDEVNIFQPDPKMIKIMNIKRELVEKARRFSLHVNRTFHNHDNVLFEKFFETIFLKKKQQKDISTDFSKQKIDDLKELKSLYFSKYKKFFKQSKILETIEEHISSITEHNSDINVFLDLYSKNIEAKNKVIKRYLTPFINFETIINNLFDGKEIQISIESRMEGIFQIKTEGGDKIEIKHLSSGEKNLILIFFHFLFEIDEKTFFMIDEPELSLHIDWQYHILKYFNEYSQNNQIFVVTHSPDILQNFKDCEINLNKCIIQAPNE